jgi:hypothetical protein
VQHWAHGGETKLENLVLLCRRHHRSMHEGGYSVAQAPAEVPEGWWFFKPSGERLFDAPGLPQQPDDVVAQLGKTHLEMGIVVDAAATIPDWDGSPIEWRWVL